MNSKIPPSLSPLAKTLIIDGHYTHYKGFPYKVIAIALHSETLEELVVYQALYGERGIWVRPVAMFLGNVSVDGISQPRFKQVNNTSSA